MFKVWIQFTKDGIDEGVPIEARDPETCEPLCFDVEADAWAEADLQRSWKPAEGTRRRRAWVEDESPAKPAHCHFGEVYVPDCQGCQAECGGGR